VNCSATRFVLKNFVATSPLFLISNLRRVLDVVCFLLGNSAASEFYMPTFRNTMLHLRMRVGTYLPAYADGTVCSEMSAYKIQTPGNYPEENMQQVRCF
jgi:hypothetical protein